MDPTDPLAAEAAQLAAAVGTITRGKKMDEYTLAACERQALGLLVRMRNAKREAELILSTISPVLQALVSAAEETGSPLSNEIESVIQAFKDVGMEFRESGTRRPSRPLDDAPKEPTGFSVFVDEAGSGSFTDAAQPMMCIAGVVVKDDVIEPFEATAVALLQEYGLADDVEFHAGAWLSIRKNDPVPGLAMEQRHELLHRFLAQGLERAEGLHHLTMAKQMVKPDYREKIQRQGFDAYTKTVLWFAVTLDRALLPVTLPAGYKYFYDRTTVKEIGVIFRALQDHPDPKLRLIGFRAGPTPLDSKSSRFIQVADVAAYYLNRYRDFEVTVLTPRKGLEKHEAKVRDVFAIIQKKLLTYIGKDLYRTWSAKALEEFSLVAARKIRRG